MPVNDCKVLSKKKGTKIKAEKAKLRNSTTELNIWLLRYGFRIESISIKSK